MEMPHAGLRLCSCQRAETQRPPRHQCPGTVRPDYPRRIPWPRAPGVATGRPRCQAYAQRRPLERPSLATYASAYRVSVAQVQRRLNGKQPKPTPEPSLVERLRSASANELAEAGREFGTGKVWDLLIIPNIGNGKAGETRS